ncbi:ABC transporter permease [candidate division KSB1 bacterium]|nr:ABC transporter permease [candidate division KSB1 bacterium]
MNVGESFNMAITAIMSNKLRSSLTLLGIIIGVMTIIAMQSLITGLRNSVHEELSQLGSNVFQVQKYPAIGEGNREKYRNRKDLTVEHADAVRRLATAAELVGAEVWHFGREIRYQDKKTNPNMVIAGATPEFLVNNGFTLADGRFVTEQDVNFNRRVCILGLEPVNVLFPYDDPIGKDVKIEGERFRVVGVLEEMGSFLGGSRDNRIVIPISRFELLYGSERSINITVKAKSPELFETCRDQTIGILRAVRKVPPGEENDFEIWTSDQLMEFFDNMTRVVKIVAVAIASIALVVAGVGIMNIMLVSVTERTREIGIRKSIGAKRRDILWQFLIEAIVLSEIGGIIGIFIGLGIGKLVEVLTPVPADVPAWTVVLGLVFCSTVGLIFGVGPATKAARMDPIEALRYE